MNSLDLEVKKMMLQYPSIFPSRLECLHHLFATNGTGYEWEGGKLVYHGIDDDLMPEHIKMETKHDYGLASTQMDEYEEVRLTRENMVRQFTEDNIDFLCQDIHHTGSRMSWINVYPMSWNYCAMSYAAEHPHRIDQEWRSGIREFIHWYLPGVNGYYGLYNDRGNGEGPDVSRIRDPRIKSNYELCQKVLKMCQTDGDRIFSFLNRKRMRKMFRSEKK